MIKFQLNTIKGEEWIVKKYCASINVKNCQKRGINIFLPKLSIKEEYNLKRMKFEVKRMQKFWNKESGNFITKVETLFNKKAIFIIKPTAYSTYGSYNPTTNEIFININIGDKYITRTIKHEMIHIVIYSYVRKLNIRDKESVVSSLYSTLEIE